MANPEWELEKTLDHTAEKMRRMDPGSPEYKNAAEACANLALALSRIKEED